MQDNRKELIAQMREKRMTYEEIAGVLHISKQRVHQIYKDYRGNLSKSTKKKIWEWDGYKCVLCDEKRKLEIHHIDGNNKNNKPENLITFCQPHHLLVETELHRDGTKSEEPKLGMGLRVLIENRKCGIEGCENIFSVKSTSKQRYCSRSCSYQRTGGGEYVICPVCKNTKLRPHSWILRGTKFCSRKCRDIAHTEYNDAKHEYYKRKAREWSKNNPEKIKEIRHKQWLRRWLRRKAEKALKNKG